MTSTLTELKKRSDADAEKARQTYARLLSKSASSKGLTKLEGDSLHAACKELGITPEAAAEDEATLRRVAELDDLGKSWDARTKKLTDEQNDIGDRWSTSAMTEARLKLTTDFGVGRERLAWIDREHVAIAREKHQLKTLRQNPRLFS